MFVLCFLVVYSPERDKKIEFVTWKSFVFLQDYIKGLTFAPDMRNMHMKR